MHRLGNTRVRFVAGALLVALLGATAFSAELLPPGFRPLPLGVHALAGGNVVVKPGETLQRGTVVIRDGLIEAVGREIAVPADARVWNMRGKTIYAGFIEPYLVLNASNPPVSTFDRPPIARADLTSGGVRFFGAPGARTDMGKPGPGHAITKIAPQFRALEHYSPNDKTLGPLRELGFTAAVIAPAKGILRGSSALVALSDDNPNRAVIKPQVFQHVAFETHQKDEEIYPGSLMGVIAAVRQAFFDAQHYAAEHEAYSGAREARRRPDYNPALEALQPVLKGKLPVMFEPGSALMNSRAASVARELGLDFCLVSSGQEWRRPDLARATSAVFVVPVHFPTLPKLPMDEDWEQVTLDQLRAWDWAPENPAMLRASGLDIAFTTYGLSEKKEFRRKLQLALDRGLSEADAIAALTTVPARLCGVENHLGTIEPGKLANLVVVDGRTYFDPEAKVTSVWIDGRVYPVPDEEPRPGEPEPAEPVETESPEPGTPTPPREEPETTPRLPAQEPGRAEPERSSEPTPTATEKEEQPDLERERAREWMKRRVARSPLEGRGAILVPSHVLIRNATIWTCGPQGILTNAQLLVSGGRIQMVGHANVQLAADTHVIDGDGLHVTPGIIDCHSHAAIVGNVNEPTLPSTAMVRISDVVNSETDNLYEQLAGGVTTINLLHGSANPIGGQNCVIKLRDGAAPDELVFSNAPPGIKFALGENVKQSNWGEKFVTRFPQTRMGVRTFFENRFIAARQYLNAWERYRADGGVPPRRDLELEAIGEILEGKRWIHSHGYRHDEMLMLLRLMQEFGVQIATFQHGLEAYKIADELAAANVGVSSFSDWWGYKFEVYDSIPFNGPLLHQRGVLVSFNSDSSDLARRLYLEAAKAVKYGGTPEEEALKLVTVNPAKQLRIDAHVGSLEPGKDADFVIWSRSPLDFRTVCLQTWIEGKKYFDRELEPQRSARIKSEREALLAKAKRMAASGSTRDGATAGADEAFFRMSLEHEFDAVDRHCLDE